MQLRYLKRDGDLGPKLQRLIEGPCRKRHAGDTARKT